MGLGEDILERKKPAIVKGLDDLEIVQVECGGMHTVALTNEGKVITAKLTKLLKHKIFTALALQIKFPMIIPCRPVVSETEKFFSHTQHRK